MASMSRVDAGAPLEVARAVYQGCAPAVSTTRPIYRPVHLNISGARAVEQWDDRPYSGGNTSCTAIFGVSAGAWAQPSKAPVNAQGGAGGYGVTRSGGTH